MPAHDSIHEAVKNALTKEGWTITNDPFILVYETDKFYADLRAERPATTESPQRIIVVEIKSLLGPSLMHELEVALGQYQVYHSILQATAPDHRLFLAIQEESYEKLLARPTFQLIKRAFQLALVIVNTEREEVKEWIS